MKEIRIDSWWWLYNDITGDEEINGNGESFRVNGREGEDREVEFAGKWDSTDQGGFFFCPLL